MFRGGELEQITWKGRRTLQLQVSPSTVSTRSDATGQIVTNFMYGSQQVRTVVIDGEPWFVAKDVCDVLEIANVGNALTKLDPDEKNSIRLTDGTPDQALLLGRVYISPPPRPNLKPLRS